MPNQNYKLKITIGEERKFFGPGVEQLLIGVRQKQSLRQAAADMGMSYSKAVKIIALAEQSLGFSLLERQRGGTDGGGSHLTPAGEVYLDKYQNFCRRLEDCAERYYREIFGE